MGLFTFVVSTMLSRRPLRALPTASLCRSAYDHGPDHARRMVALLVDGLRYGTGRPEEAPR
jgi:hypothetical protein